MRPRITILMIASLATVCLGAPTGARADDGKDQCAKVRERVSRKAAQREAQADKEQGKRVGLEESKNKDDDRDAAWLQANCCVSNGSCSATPACGQTATGVDNCGKSCTVTGPACCVPNGSCSANPACGQTATGADNCGNACTVTGPACCVPSSCSAATPVCGQTTTGVDNCGGACSVYGVPPNCTPPLPTGAPLPGH